jgi:hypothetical protein
MDSGGRFYRAFWQSLPKALRAAILIDGGPIAEHDYEACHLLLAYLAVGAEVGDAGPAGRDRYSLDGFGGDWRRRIKVGVQILLNAKTIRGATGALASKIHGETWEARVEIAVALINAIKARHSALAPLWHSGCGLGLQFVDAELVRLCGTELISRGIVPLPVHDSMLVRAEHIGDLKEVMERRFIDDGRRLALERFRSLRTRGLRVKDLTLGRGAASGRDATAPRIRSPRFPSLSHVPTNSEPQTLNGGVDPVTSEAFDRLVAHPIVCDLRTIAKRRGWISGGVIRSALLSAAPLYPSNHLASVAVRAWIGTLTSEAKLTFDNDRLEAEIVRFMARKPTPIAPQTIARLCGVTRSMAKEFALAHVLPAQRKPTPPRRAVRMEAKLPRVIDVKKAAPWGTMGRSKWYAQTTPIERQVAALKAIVVSGDATALFAARAAVERTQRERASLSSDALLPVDRLLEQLTAVLLPLDNGQLDAPTDLADVSVQYQGIFAHWFSKPYPHQHRDNDGSPQILELRTFIATLTPALQLWILRPHTM